MAEPTAIQQLRTERTQRWQRALHAYNQGAAAYHRAVSIYEAALTLPHWPRVVVAPSPLPEPIPFTPLRGGAEAKPGRLTGRQVEIARLIADGLTNRQIARELVLTEGTVANHVRAILLRLGVRCRAQVAAWWVQGGHIPGKRRATAAPASPFTPHQAIS
jgi:DNA-binding NarL/FixJ family response regulator